MKEDPDTDLARIRRNGVSTPLFFGTVYVLTGTDILCSPRGYGPAWIIKTCIDFASYLFDPESGLQNLMNSEF